jgi:PPOX class probable F420-dependent enzyme
MTDPAATLEAQSRYLNLSTFRRDGSAVDTPLWFAARDGRLLAFTHAGSGKVKRLRRSPRARVAPCDLRGRPLGPALEASARLVDDAARAESIFAALRRRYGWQFRLLELGARLGGRRRAWTALEIELAPPVGPV